MASARAAAARPMPAWIALWASAVLHLGALWLLVLLYPGGAAFAGGEGGLGGAGGETVEITMTTVASRGDEEPHRGLVEPAPAQEPAADEAEIVTPTERGTRRSDVLVAPSDTREAARASRERVTPTDSQEPDGAAAEERAPSGPTAALPQGDVAQGESQGRAEGPDVAGVILGGIGLGGATSSARSVLQEALTCDDPVVGTWVAHRYSPDGHDWARMTLRITREGDVLSGTITARMWAGRATDRQPPPCTPEGWDATVRMAARGAYRSGEMSFGANAHESPVFRCPAPFGFSYQPDHFTGRIDLARDELDTVNNDGGRDVNAPYRFRRLSCEP